LPPPAALRCPLLLPFLAPSSYTTLQDGILPGLGKKTQKQREDAFMKLLSHFESDQERIDLFAFFDLLDEHNVQVEDKEVDDLCRFADVDGNIGASKLLNYARTSEFWQILIKKDVYADPEVCSGSWGS
jgi:hypothetical protein